MNSEQRRAAVHDYKERKAEAGIYALRCTPTGEVWVGRAGDVDAARNRLLFAVRLASTPHRALAAAARAYGEAGFAYEVLERLEEALTPAMQTLALKQRLKHWAEALGATAI